MSGCGAGAFRHRELREQSPKKSFPKLSLWLLGSGDVARTFSIRRGRNQLGSDVFDRRPQCSGRVAGTAGARARSAYDHRTLDVRCWARGHAEAGLLGWLHRRAKAKSLSMPKSRRRSTFFSRGVLANSAHRISPSLPASLPGVTICASADLPVPILAVWASSRWRFGKTKKPAAHEEVAGAGAGSRTVRSCIRPGHFGGGGGPLAETFVRIGRPSAP